MTPVRKHARELMQRFLAGERRQRCGGATGSPQPSGTNTAGGGGQVFGPGCSSLPSSGAGSLSSMASQPVATAVASNPQLSTLANAIKTAGLTDTLNNAQNLTVFAPTDDGGYYPEYAT